VGAFLNGESVAVLVANDAERTSYVPVHTVDEGPLYRHSAARTGRRVYRTRMHGFRAPLRAQGAVRV
jgi:hypothetical protein